MAVIRGVMHSDANTVSEYLASLPEDRRNALSAVRDVILANLPQGMVETMSWGMISYEVPLSIEPDTYNGKPLLYAALASQKRHMAVYLTGIYIDDDKRRAFETAWAEAGHELDAGKSCVRFTRLEKVPLRVVGEAIEAYSTEGFVERVREVHAKRG